MCGDDLSGGKMSPFHPYDGAGIMLTRRGRLYKQPWGSSVVRLADLI